MILNDFHCSVDGVCELRIKRNAVGRPSVEVEEEWLTFYIENGFKVEEMALMCCSKRTVEQKINFLWTLDQKFHCHY